MTQRWARILVSTAAAVMLSVSLLGAVGQPAAAKEPKLSAAVTDPALLVVTAKIALNPVTRTAAFDFGKSYKKRVVTLQRYQYEPAAWVKVGSATKLSSSGKVTFTLTINPDDTYRAVVDTYGKSPAKASKSVKLSDQWVSTFEDDFTADALGTMWSPRGEGYQVDSRLCSVPHASMGSVAEGNFVASIAKNARGSEFHQKLVATANPRATDARATALAKAAKLKSKSARKAAIKKADADYKAALNCVRGAFDNAAVSTQNNTDGFTINTAKPGIVSARIKFPMAQGVHGSIWLQNYTSGGGEIDFIESFGYGAGLTSYIHVPKPSNKLYVAGTPGEFTKKGGYVLTSKKNDKKWWSSYHDYSVEWTTTHFIFRIDGKTTKTLKITPGNTDYYLVMSLLSSDWELGRMQGTKKGDQLGKGKPVADADIPNQKMYVSWVRAWTKAS